MQRPLDELEESDSQAAAEVEEGSPPVFRTWPQLYAFVLILHAVIIFLFYLFTNAYS
ncbi:MAG: hypothetical protein AAFV95_23560 [Bacteroidota bacterium]